MDQTKNKKKKEENWNQKLTQVQDLRTPPFKSIT